MTAYPDNEINKELYARLNNLDVDGTTFKFFIQRVTSEKAKYYFLKSTQLAQPNYTKCGTGFRSSTEIQVTVILPMNTGSEEVLNKAVAELYTAIEDFSLPAPTGLSVNDIDISVDNNLTEIDGSEVIYRKIVRLEATIN